MLKDSANAAKAFPLFYLCNVHLWQSLYANAAKALAVFYLMCPGECCMTMTMPPKVSPLFTCKALAQPLGQCHQSIGCLLGMWLRPLPYDSANGAKLCPCFTCTTLAQPLGQCRQSFRLHFTYVSPANPVCSCLSLCHHNFPPCSYFYKSGKHFRPMAKHANAAKAFPVFYLCVSNRMLNDSAKAFPKALVVFYVCVSGECCMTMTTWTMLTKVSPHYLPVYSFGTTFRMTFRYVSLANAVQQCQ